MVNLKTADPNLCSVLQNHQQRPPTHRQVHYIYIYICIYFQLYIFSIFREIYFQLGIYWNLLLFDMYLPGSTHFINLNFLILLGFFVVDVN